MDTMNFWIEGEFAALKQVLERVDLLVGSTPVEPPVLVVDVAVERCVRRVDESCHAACIPVSGPRAQPEPAEQGVDHPRPLIMTLNPNREPRPGSRATVRPRAIARYQLCSLAADLRPIPN